MLCKPVLTAATALALAAFSPASAKTPSGMEFYATGPGSDGSVELSADMAIPLAVGETCYGWNYRYGETAPPKVVKERLILPAPATDWGGSDMTKVAPDRASAVTRMPVIGGEASNQWCVAAGDPPGRYTLEIRGNGKLLGTRSFVLAGGAAPGGNADTKYCMRVEAVTGSRLERVKCWTRQGWAEKGVDVDKDWGKEGVRIID